MRTSYLIAGALALAGGAWIASGFFVGSETPASANETPPEAREADLPVPAVRIRAVRATSHLQSLVINGRTEESRKVVLRAETAGPIREITAKEGRPVKEGDVIARIDVEDRRALLAEAQALVKQREIEYRAATELSRKGFRSDTKLAEARALLDAARASVESMNIDLSRTAIRAPFDGMLETRSVEKGDYVQAGDEIASIVDLDPILAVGYVSERDIGKIEVGAAGSVQFVDGGTADGTVTYVATVADSATRSFRVEMEIPNPGHKVRSGLTGELRLPLSPVNAYFISPAVLTLSDDGRIGVRTVNASDVVEFVPVTILDDTNEGFWVAGMKDGDRLITVGHEYVKAGQKVRPVAETPETAS